MYYKTWHDKGILYIEHLYYYRKKSIIEFYRCDMKELSVFIELLQQIKCYSNIIDEVQIYAISVAVM